MALTRNDSAVHERKGIYSMPKFAHTIGLVANKDIDLRLFMASWAFCFAVSENERHSLQFFRSNGEAAHKIYMTEESAMDKYRALIEEFQTENVAIVTKADEVKVSDKPEVDVPAFQESWLALKDTHDFFAMFNKYKLTRIEALQHAPDGYTRELKKDGLTEILNLVSERGMEFMVFVGNKGAIQIHTGKGEKIVQTGPWINVLDPEFNLHARLDHIKSVWHVIKPTDYGKVNSIEIFDHNDEIIIQLFGKRKPGLPEPQDWIDLVTKLK